MKSPSNAQLCYKNWTDLPTTKLFGARGSSVHPQTLPLDGPDSRLGLTENLTPAPPLQQRLAQIKKTRFTSNQNSVALCSLFLASQEHCAEIGRNREGAIFLPASFGATDYRSPA